MSQQEQMPLHEADTAAPIPARTLRRAGIAALLLALLVAALGLTLRAVQARQVASWTDAQAVPTVALIRPQPSVGAREQVLPGDVRAWYEAPLYARVNGYLKDWYFDYGAHVHKGQVLADIDAPDLDAQLAAAVAGFKAKQAQVQVAQAQMQFARTTYVRWRDSPRGVVSEQEQASKKADYDSAVAHYDAAQADVNASRGLVERLQALEQFKHIVAPFDGIVTARNTDIGALIDAGSGSGAGSAPQLFRVADVHRMRVFVQVPQELSAGIHEGMSAQLYIPQYPQRLFPAQVATTSGSINTTSRTLLVELHAANPDGLLQPGSFTEVHFQLPADSGLLRIPTSALLFRQAGAQVAVLGPGDRVQLRSVTLGHDLGTQVEVLRGLAATDRLIDSPSDSLAQGDLVRVATPTAAPAAATSRNPLAVSSAPVPSPGRHGS